MDDFEDIVNSAIKLKGINLSQHEKQNGLPAGILTRLIKTESSFNPNAISPAGAQGLTQLMPETARAYGVTNPFDPESNVAGGARYLGDLIKQYNGNIHAAVAHYNGGTKAGKAVLSGLEAPAEETRSYIQKVAGNAIDDQRNPDVSPFDDFEDVINSALTRNNKINPAVNHAQEQTNKQDISNQIANNSSQSNILDPYKAALAGAGESLGKGALSLQQIAGKGTSFLGDITHSDILKKAGGWLEQDALKGVKKLEAENAPFASANPVSNILGQVGGFIVSPINKLVPGFGPAESLSGAALRGAGQGSVLNALSVPVTNEEQPFLWEKIKQLGIGAVGGTLGGTIGYGISKIPKAIDAAISGLKRVGNKISGNNIAYGADDVLTKTFSEAGIPINLIKKDRPELYAGLKTQVENAIKTGSKIDEGALARLAEAQTLPVPIPMLKGQLTRDPIQYAMEQNVRGIKGVGDPITKILEEQNTGFIKNINKMGADNAPNIVAAGSDLIPALKEIDEAAQRKVRDAYEAYKNATGKKLEVPLQGLAQDYAKTLSEFGDKIPSAIRTKMESLGLLSGTLKKVFSIDEAESLIKSINKNYDPKELATARALNELRAAIEKAVFEGSEDNVLGSEAMKLAKNARNIAKNRFETIKQTPALEGALYGAHSDDFVKKFVLNGKISEIKNLVKILKNEDPAALETLQNSIMGHIKSKVLKGRSDENGIFSEDVLKKLINDPNTSARLNEVLGPQKMSLLKQLQSVAENANFAPVSAAVNRSNTASAATNIVNSEIGTGKLNSIANLAISAKFPFAPDLKDIIQKSKGSKMINEMINPSLIKPLQNHSRLNFLKDYRVEQIPRKIGAAYVSEQSQKSTRRSSR